MSHIPLPLSKGLITKSALEPRFGRVDLCCEVSFGFVLSREWLEREPWICSRKNDKLAEFGSGGTQVEGLQYVGRLIVRRWSLKWNCFFIVQVSWVADIWMMWFVGAEGIGKCSRPKASNSLSISDNWLEDRFLMAFLWKFDFSSRSCFISLHGSL